MKFLNLFIHNSSRKKTSSNTLPSLQLSERNPDDKNDTVKSAYLLESTAFSDGFCFDNFAYGESMPKSKSHSKNTEKTKVNANCNCQRN